MNEVSERSVNSHTEHDTKFIERKILIGLVISIEYLDAVVPHWNINYIQARPAKIIAEWCIEFYTVYNKAPLKEIETIYQEKKEQFDTDTIEDLADILFGLSEEYVNSGTFNFQYIRDRTFDYFKQRALDIHTRNVEDLTLSGEVDKANELVSNYLPPNFEVNEDGLFVNSSDGMNSIIKAFDRKIYTVIRYPGPLGDMLNNQLVRDGFVAFLAPEKRGKSFLLLELAMRACGVRKVRGTYGDEGMSNVAFFQAGDMSQNQQLRRIAMYCAMKSDIQDYNKDLYMPLTDCVYNQTNTCPNPELRENKSVELFNGITKEDIYHVVEKEQLVNACKINKGYKVCTRCDYWKTNGTVYYKFPEDDIPVLDKETAVKAAEKFFNRTKKRFKLSSHPNGTLSVSKVRQLLKQWERSDGFVPDVIVIDYADLLVNHDNSNDYRHSIDKVWRDLRGLSQERHCLVVTATQANAKSYKQDTLYLDNFADDKRKYGHVTAMYGINQDKTGREKSLGLMRLNQLVIRDGECSPQTQVYVLQNLSMGRAYLGSFKR